MADLYQLVSADDVCSSKSVMIANQLRSVLNEVCYNEGDKLLLALSSIRQSIENAGFVSTVPAILDQNVINLMVSLFLRSS